MNQCNETRIRETRKILEIINRNLTEVENYNGFKLEEVVHDSFKAMEECLV